MATYLNHGITLDTSTVCVCGSGAAVDGKPCPFCGSLDRKQIEVMYSDD